MHTRIESLLEESYNERMHLLVFLKMQRPGAFMRFMVLAAQGKHYTCELSRKTH